MPSCGAETHLFSSHPTIDASEASASRAWGPCRPVSPKDSIKASHETRNRPEECLDSAMAGRPRALLSRDVTKRHDLAMCCLCCLLCSACFVACRYCMTAGWGETEVLMDVSSRRLARVLHRHLAEHGLLSFLSLLRAFRLNVIKRNQVAGGRRWRASLAEPHKNTGKSNYAD